MRKLISAAAMVGFLFLAGSCEPDGLSGVWTGSVQIEIFTMEMSFDLAESMGSVTGSAVFLFGTRSADTGPVTGTYQPPDVELELTLTWVDWIPPGRYIYSGKLTSDDRISGHLFIEHDPDPFPVILERR